jgi:hypothetical protein
MLYTGLTVYNINIIVIVVFSWKPDQNQTDNYLNIGRKTLFLTPEKGTNFSFPVEHIVYILNKEPAKTIFQIENNPDDIIAQLKEISKLRPEFEKRVTIKQNWLG